jgi:hypothetical protein
MEKTSTVGTAGRNEQLTFIVVLRMIGTHFNNVMKITGALEHCHGSDVRWIH